ncbi:MAG: gas vesicle protein [Myxococcales bacterium]
MAELRRGLTQPESGKTTTGSGGSANLADVLERVLDKGIVIAGDVKLLITDIELLTLQIRLVICSVDKAREIGLDWWTTNPAFSSRARGALPEKTEQGQADVSEQSLDLEERLRRIEESLTPVPTR